MPKNQKHIFDNYNSDQLRGRPGRSIKSGQPLTRQETARRLAAAQKRRRKARNRAISRMLIMSALVLIIATSGVYAWSSKDKIGSFFSGMFNFGQKTTESTPEGSKPGQSPGNTSESNGQNTNEPSRPDYAADGYDFTLEEMTDNFLPGQRAIVLIDPGHGGIDGGAPGRLADNTRIAESTVVLDIAQKLKENLLDRNIEVYMIREDDSFYSLYARVARASLLSIDYLSAYQPELVSDRSFIEHMQDLLMVPVEINSDNPASGGFGFMKGYGMGQEQMSLIDIQQECDNVIFISLHCNAHNTDKSLHGMQAYYVHDDYVEQDEAAGLAEQTDPAGFGVYMNRDNDRNQDLAQIVYDSTITRAPQLAGTNAGKPVLPGNYAVLREHGLAGTLLELGYMSNSNDLPLLIDSAFQSKLAEGIADGIESYFSKALS